MTGFKIDTKLEVEECPICILPLDSEPKFIKTPCNHCFHKDCLVKWVIEKDNKCPICKSNVPEYIDDDHGLIIITTSNGE